MSRSALTYLRFPFTMSGMAADPHIGTSIKRARERKRWTQRQLADALGVDRKSVDNWENGRTSPRSSIGALEEVLGISLAGPAPEAEELTPLDEWEAAVLADGDLPDHIKRQLISDSRDARARYAARRSELPEPGGAARRARNPRAS